MNVRPETAEDIDAIREIHRAAFADDPYSHQTEHLILEGLRADGALSVSLVAELDGVIRGHVAFSEVTIGGKRCGWFGLGPIGVDPAHQGRGIGGRLVEAGVPALPPDRRKHSRR